MTDKVCHNLNVIMYFPIQPDYLFNELHVKD